MLECINKECIDCKEGKCQNKRVISGESGCCTRIKPTHTPTYAEEQLEHTKKKTPSYQGEHIEDIKEPINYEEEYKKLKAENAILRVNYNGIKEIREELRKENRELSKKNTELENKVESLKRVVNELNDLI